MTVRLDRAEIDRYGPLVDCRPPLEDDLTIVAGPNESGKTLYLEALLQILDPDVRTHMDPDPRVGADPTGRVVLEEDGTTHELGEETRLPDVSPIDAHHLRNLFVIRDSDLALPEGPDYYTSLVEQLGNIHTSEIEAIVERLCGVGHITKRSRNLVDRKGEYTGTAKEEAVALADDIEAYLEQIEDRGIGDLARDRLRTRRELRQVEADLERQETARDLARLESGRANLDTHRSANERLAELAAFDRETLEELRDLEGEIERTEAALEGLEEDLAAAQAKHENLQDELQEARADRRELQRREPDVDALEESLSEYRDRTSGDPGAMESSLVLRRRAAIAALLGAGIAGTAGALADSVPAFGISAGLLVAAGAAWWFHHRLASGVEDAASREGRLVQEARDAGLEVADVEEIAPIVRGFQESLESAIRRVQRLETETDSAADRIDALETDTAETDQRLQDLEDQLATALSTVGVESIAAFEERVEERETTQRERRGARIYLETELGQPDSDDPAEKTASWAEELDGLAADLGDTDVDPDDLDETRLEALREQQAELDDRLDTLESDLQDFKERLDEFQRRAHELNPPDFVEAAPELRARTVVGLEDLESSLRDVVDEIERNATVSREAIGLLDAIAAEEAEKVSTLFDPEGPASRTFEALTDGRYTAVDYDPDAETLTVTTADGTDRPVHQLSRGTRDQLYFAARRSLASQLLRDGTGFLLLDDPFLAADSERLRNGFETLQRLTEEGWQIVYLTAKAEVYEGMAGEFGYHPHRLEALDP